MVEILIELVVIELSALSRAFFDQVMGNPQHRLNHLLSPKNQCVINLINQNARITWFIV